MYNIAAAGSVDREFGGPSKGQIGPFKGSEGGLIGIFCNFCFFFIFWAGNGLTEGREEFETVPGGRRIHSG